MFMTVWLSFVTRWFSEPFVLPSETMFVLVRTRLLTTLSSFDVVSLHGTWTPTGSTTSVWLQTLTGVSGPVMEAEDPLNPECEERYGSTTTPSYVVPEPKCTIGAKDCAGLWSSFLSAHPSWTSGANNEPITPACSPTGAAFSSAYTDPNENACQVSGNNVRLYYWPPTTTQTNPCAYTTPSNNSVPTNATIPASAGATVAPPFPTVGPNITGGLNGTYGMNATNGTITGKPVVITTAVINGVTVTSPDILLEIDSLAAAWHNPFPDSFGTTLNASANFTNIKVTVPPSDLSSIIQTIPDKPFSEVLTTLLGLGTTPGPAFQGQLTAEPYVFEDIYGPVRARPYFLASTPLWNNWTQSGAQLPGKSLTTIFDYSYQPWISIPTQIRSLDSRLATCSLAINGLYDPPQPISGIGFTTIESQGPVAPPGGPSPAPGSTAPPAPPQTTDPIVQGPLQPVNPPSQQPPSTAPPPADPNTNKPAPAPDPNTAAPAQPAPAQQPPATPQQTQGNGGGALGLGSSLNNPAPAPAPAPTTIGGALGQNPNPAPAQPAPAQPAPQQPAPAPQQAAPAPAPQQAAPAPQQAPPAPQQAAPAPQQAAPAPQQAPPAPQQAAPAPQQAAPAPQQAAPAPQQAAPPPQQAAPAPQQPAPQPAAPAQPTTQAGDPNRNSGTGSGSNSNNPQPAAPGPAQAQPATPNNVGGAGTDPNNGQVAAPVAAPPPNDPASSALASFISNAGTSPSQNPVAPQNAGAGSGGQGTPQQAGLNGNGGAGTGNVGNPGGAVGGDAGGGSGNAGNAGGAVGGNAGLTGDNGASSGGANVQPQPGLNNEAGGVGALNFGNPNAGPSPQSSSVQVNLGGSTINLPVPSGASLGGNGPGQGGSNQPANSAVLSAGGAPLIIGSHSLSVAPGGLLDMDGTLTAPPGPMQTGIGAIANPSSIADGISHAAENLQPGSSLVVGDHTVSRAPDGHFAVDGQTTFAHPGDVGSALALDAAIPSSIGNSVGRLSPGGAPMTLDGHTISRAPNGDFIADGSAFHDASDLGTALASNAIAQSSIANGLGQKLVNIPSGAATSLNGHVVQHLPNGAYVDGDTTFTDPHALANVLASTAMSESSQSSSLDGALSRIPINSGSVINGHRISRLANGAYVEDGTSTFKSANALASDMAHDAIASASATSSINHALASLRPGAETILNGHSISRLANGAFAEDGTSTFSAASELASALAKQLPKVASLDPQESMMMASALSHLQPGHKTVIGGHTFSENAAGSIIVDGKSTYPGVGAVVSAMATPGPGAVIPGGGSASATPTPAMPPGNLVKPSNANA
ncbi:MAG: hypothetical protein Q9159_005483, partial [Coniocarpon cinnabarinum]